MGKKVENGDYAKPLFIRIYQTHRAMLDELALTFELLPIKYPRKGHRTCRPITDTEIIRVAIEQLHKRRVGKTTKRGIP